MLMLDCTPDSVDVVIRQYTKLNAHNFNRTTFFTGIRRTESAFEMCKISYNEQLSRGEIVTQILTEQDIQGLATFALAEFGPASSEEAAAAREYISVSNPNPSKIKKIKHDQKQLE